MPWEWPVRLHLLIFVLVAGSRHDYTQTIISRFGLDATEQAFEVAIKHGYLLQYFRSKGAPMLDIESASNHGAAAKNEGHRRDLSRALLVFRLHDYGVDVRNLEWGGKSATPIPEVRVYD
jgi:hypothetical protein